MTPTELHRLPSRERADYYREQAEEALAAAKKARDPMARTSFLALADRWMKLADHCDHAEEAAPILPVLERPANHSTE